MSRLTRLYHFSQTAYGLQSPYLRLTHAVTSVSPRFSMECVGSALFQSHFQRPADKHFVAHPKFRAKKQWFHMVSEPPQGQFWCGLSWDTKGWVWSEVPFPCSLSPLQIGTKPDAPITSCQSCSESLLPCLNLQCYTKTSWKRFSPG